MTQRQQQTAFVRQVTALLEQRGSGSGTGLATTSVEEEGHGIANNDVGLVLMPRGTAPRVDGAVTDAVATGSTERSDPTPGGRRLITFSAASDRRSEQLARLAAHHRPVANPLADQGGRRIIKTENLDL